MQTKTNESNPEKIPNEPAIEKPRRSRGQKRSERRRARRGNAAGKKAMSIPRATLHGRLVVGCKRAEADGSQQDLASRMPVLYTRSRSKKDRDTSAGASGHPRGGKAAEATDNGKRSGDKKQRKAAEGGTSSARRLKAQAAEGSEGSEGGREAAAS